jgi:LysR family transcriptional regulator, glycine cleavage system transcriptional activator
MAEISSGMLMRKRLPSLSALRAFEVAARLRSFKQAADELAVTATAISHRIRALEDEIGCRLFVRKTRAVELTPEGRSLYAAVRDGFDTIASGIDRLRQRARPSIKLSTTPAFAAKWLVPRLAAFQAQHPHIDMHVHASNRPVDLSSGALDIAIRYGQGRYDGMRSTLLMQDRFAPAASPALGVATAADLPRRTLIHFDWDQPLPVDLTWAAWARAAELPELNTEAGIRYSDESHAIQAAVAGQGVALLSLVLIQQELQLGVLESRLTPVLDGLAYYIVRPERETPGSVAAIVESWLLEQASLAR